MRVKAACTHAGHHGNAARRRPAEIAGYKVAGVTDYETEGTGLPKADVLEYRLENGAKLMVRPSGTEPKIKVYLSAVAGSEAAADAINEQMGAAADLWMQGVTCKIVTGKAPGFCEASQNPGLFASGSFHQLPVHIPLDDPGQDVADLTGGGGVGQTEQNPPGQPGCRWWGSGFPPW